jgi:hypothetical protein
MAGYTEQPYYSSESEFSARQNKNRRTFVANAEVTTNGGYGTLLSGILPNERVFISAFTLNHNNNSAGTIAGGSLVITDTGGNSILVMAKDINCCIVGSESPTGNIFLSLHQPIQLEFGKELRVYNSAHNNQYSTATAYGWIETF